MLLLVSLAMAAPLAECPRVYVTGELRDALDSADAAFAAQDATGFGESLAIARQRVACFGEPLVAAELARIHLAEALAAFLAADTPATTEALAAMAAASPGYQIPLSLVPDGHPLRSSMGAAGLSLRDPGEVLLLTPDAGWIEVDGAFQKGVAANRHAVVQRFGPDGKVTETRYHRAGTDLGDWAKGAAGAGKIAAAPKAPKPPKPAPATKPAPAPKPAGASVAPTLNFRGDLGAGFGIAANREIAVDDVVYAVNGFGGLAGTLGGGVVFGTPTFAGTFDLGWSSALALSSEAGMVEPSWHGGFATLGGQYRQSRWSFEAGFTYAIFAVTAEAPAWETTGPAAVSGTVGSPGGKLGAAIRLGETSPWALTGQLAGWVGTSAPAGIATLGVRYDSGWAAAGTAAAGTN